GPTQGEALTALAFDGSASSDSDGTIVRYRFDFGDGTPPVEGTPSQMQHTFAIPGSYTVTLQVTDNDGLTASDSHTLTIASFVRLPQVMAEGIEHYGSACQLEMQGSVAHLLYLDDTHPSLWYGRWNGTSWQTELVDGMGFNVGGEVMQVL